MTELAASTLSDAPDESSATPESDVTAPASAVASRADSPVSEVTERFLRSIIATVPLERIEELHLFAPLKQGGVETGIAVVAARVLLPVPVPVDAPELKLEADDPADDIEVIDAKDDVLPAEASDDEPVEVAEPAATPLVRHTVYTARYRLVLKGPERGRWEADVVAEADAPLLTVEAVVRGVQRRAGEETEILLYSDRQIARALRMTWPPVIAIPDAPLPDAPVAEPDAIADPAA